MRLSKRKPSNSVAMNMTPMIDIVFLLLIFFMTVTQVSKINSEPLELPKLKGTQEQLSTELTINVTAAGEIVVSGQTVTLAELVTLLADQVESQAGDPSRLAVALRADRRGASRTVNQVVTALGKLGLTRVRLAVEASEY